ATFRHDTSVERYSDQAQSAPPTIGWIPLGRDIAVEQKMLAEIQACLSAEPAAPVGVPVFPALP
ncbi:MAG: hypothetical protein MI757_12275, partial [Pirellulales bacterium]|nr:hypothetical protein [Pirellulales bacterium]